MFPCRCMIDMVAITLLYIATHSWSDPFQLWQSVMLVFLVPLALKHCYDIILL